ncbi:hypothetical protein VTL71DRAFT_3786 [Oculimacula yallundae]|uniref:DUF6590 domain-containing protein n=1 Tax=Oculimacula yallundae TaxID=86028 RepID=A0ABR4C3Y9_9HELO
MASHSSQIRGKGKDNSTAWSQWRWDSRGFYTSRRLNELGVEEFDYQYPEGGTGNSEQIPRTPGATTPDRSMYQDIVFSPDQQDSYTTAIIPNIPSYALQTTRPCEPESSHGDFRQDTTRSLNFNESNNNHVTTNNARRTLLPNSASGPTGTWQSPGSSSYLLPPGSYGGKALDSIINKTQSLTLGIEEVAGQPSWQKFSGHIQNPRSSQTSEQLDPRYKVIEPKKLDRFWQVGRVFMMLWTEPAQPYQEMGKSRNGSHFSVTYLNGQAYSEIRRFVVIRKNYGNCICSPIHTYNGHATLKPNLPDAREHTIIYTGPSPPDPHAEMDKAGKMRYEELTKEPIRVIPESNSPDQNLSITSRLNYSKIYTVENYVRVLNIGKVHPNSMDHLALNSLVRPSEGPPQRFGSDEIQRAASPDHAHWGQDDTGASGEKSERGGKSKDSKKKKNDSSSTSNSKPSGSGRRR